MVQILISAFDMEIGGVERSLISLLESFDYGRFDVDLMLFRHHGEFMDLLPEGPNLLPEIPQYASFRKPVSEVLRSGHPAIAFSRIAAKYLGHLAAIRKGYKESGLIPMQLGWKFSLPVLPRLKKQYDVAISYLWPHYFIAQKVNARKKIAWVHTDYSCLEIDNKLDAEMWGKFDRIAAVSDGCRTAFLKRYPQFEERTVVIENITSPDYIRKMAKEDVSGEINDNDRDIKLVTVARLAFAKGIDDAVRACRVLLDQGYKVKWYVVGYGCEEACIRDLIRNLGLEDKFILLGKKLNPYPYIKACDIYVQPSRYEGKAVTVTEAQVLGKPVLITNYPTAASQVRDGFDGIITEQGVDGIVKGIKLLIDNPGMRRKLEENTLSTSYFNVYEIEKLYGLMEA